MKKRSRIRESGHDTRFSNKLLAHEKNDDTETKTYLEFPIISSEARSDLIEQLENVLAKRMSAADPVDRVSIYVPSALVKGPDFDLFFPLNHPVNDWFTRMQYEVLKGLLVHQTTEQREWFAKRMAVFLVSVAAEWNATHEAFTLSCEEGDLILE